MANRNRPPGTELIISEGYVKELEKDNEAKDEMVEVWKQCVSHTTDFLEILREHFDDFDKVLEHFNEASQDIKFIITPDEEIRYKIDETEESQNNN